MVTPLTRANPYWDLSADAEITDDTAPPIADYPSLQL
jgi:hypothetical protein